MKIELKTFDDEGRPFIWMIVEGVALKDAMDIVNTVGFSGDIVSQDVRFPISAKDVLAWLRTVEKSDG